MTPVLTAGWWVVTGAGDPLERRDPVLLPAFVAAEGADAGPAADPGAAHPAGRHADLRPAALRRAAHRRRRARRRRRTAAPGWTRRSPTWPPAAAATPPPAWCPTACGSCCSPRRSTAALARAIDTVPGVLRVSGQGGTVLWQVDYPTGRVRVLPAGRPGGRGRRRRRRPRRSLPGRPGRVARRRSRPARRVGCSSWPTPRDARVAGQRRRHAASPRAGTTGGRRRSSCRRRRAARPDLRPRAAAAAAVGPARAAGASSSCSPCRRCGPRSTTPTARPTSAPTCRSRERAGGCRRERPAAARGPAARRRAARRVVVLLALGVTADLTGPQPAADGTTVTVRRAADRPGGAGRRRLPRPGRPTSSTETRVSIAAPGAEDGGRAGRARPGPAGQARRRGAAARPRGARRPARSWPRADAAGRWSPGRPARSAPGLAAGMLTRSTVDAMRGLAGTACAVPGHRLLVRRQRRRGRAARPGLPHQPRGGARRRRHHAVRPGRARSTHRPAAAYRSRPAARRSGCSTRWPRASPGSRCTSTRAAAGSPPPCATSSSTA